MGFFQNLSRGANKFFGKVSKSLTGVGRDVERGFNKAVNYTEGKILPTIERVSGQVASGIDKYGIPITAVLAPEFLPVALAASGVAKGVNKGAKQIRAGIGTGRAIVKSARKGDIQGVISGGQKLRTQGEGLYSTGQAIASQIEGAGLDNMDGKTGGGNPLRR